MKTSDSRWVRQLTARPRHYLSTLAAIAVGIVLPSFGLHLVTRLLVAWNVGSILYVLLAAVMMTRSTPSRMRGRAEAQDDGKYVILALVVISAVASLAAIGGELAVVKDIHGLAKIAHVALAGLTVLSSWAFAQVSFCLRYAHDYYAMQSDGRKPGLQFPDDDPPDYGDFFY